MPIITDSSNNEHITYIDNGNVEITNVPHVIVDSAPPVVIPPVSISGVTVTTPPGQPLPVSGVVSIAGAGSGAIPVHINDQPIMVDSELIIDQTLPVSGVVKLTSSTGDMVNTDGYGGLRVSLWDQESRVWVTPDVWDGDSMPIYVHSGVGPIPVTGVVSILGFGAGTLTVTTPPATPMPVTGIVSLAGQSGGGGISVVTPAGQPLPVSGVILNTVSTTATIINTPTVTIGSQPIQVTAPPGQPVPMSGVILSFPDSDVIFSDIMPVTGIVSVSSMPPSTLLFSDAMPVSGVAGGIYQVSTTAGNPLPVSGVVSLTSTKQNFVIFSGVNLAAGAGDSSTVSPTIDLTGVQEVSVNIKLINGATGPTFGAKVYINVSGDGSDWYQHGGAMCGGVLSGATYSWGGIKLDKTVMYLQIAAGSNTAQPVTLKANIMKVLKQAGMTFPYKSMHQQLDHSSTFTRNLAFWINFSDPYSAYLHDIVNGGRSKSDGTNVDGDPYNFGALGGFEDSPYGFAFHSGPVANRTPMARTAELQLQGDWTFLWRGKIDFSGLYHFIFTHTPGDNSVGYEFYFVNTGQLAVNWTAGVPYWSIYYPPWLTSDTWFSTMMTWKQGMGGPTGYWEINGDIYSAPMIVETPWQIPVVYNNVVGGYVCANVNDNSDSWCAECALWDRWMDDNESFEVISGNALNNMLR